MRARCTQQSTSLQGALVEGPAHNGGLQAVTLSYEAGSELTSNSLPLILSLQVAATTRQLRCFQALSMRQMLLSMQASTASLVQRALPACGQLLHVCGMVSGKRHSRSLKEDSELWGPFLV